MKFNIKQYFAETLTEFKKVVWPDKRYATAATTIIIVLSLLTGVLVMIIDFILTKFFGLLLR
ncbi:MAG: preprotein translocase subunit SecE [Candidatus Margulisiibacteriota bacterium]